jgi:hypothetical protein
MIVGQLLLIALQSYTKIQQSGNFSDINTSIILCLESRMIGCEANQEIRNHSIMRESSYTLWWGLKIQGSNAFSFFLDFVTPL